MSKIIEIKFKVTSLQKETIELRAKENGFDDIPTYIKVVALKMQSFNLTSAGEPTQEPTIEFKFSVTELQKSRMEEIMKDSGCENLTSYLQYVSQHGAISATVEVRSTGGLDSMLERIKNSREAANPKRLF